MPLYEYQCKDCAHCFEYLALKSSDPPPKCPECQSDKVEKLMSAGCVRAHGIASGSGGFTAPSCAPSG